MLTAIVTPQTADFLLIGAAVAVSAMGLRACTTAAVRAARRPDVSLLVLLHVLFSAIICIAAVIHSPPLLDLAIGVPLAAAVTACTLALGVALFVAPVSPEAIDDQQVRTAGRAQAGWPFLLPASVLLLIIGFSGQIGPGGAAVLVIQGLLIVLASAKRSQGRLESRHGSSPESPDESSKYFRPTVLGVVQMLLGLALLAVAGWGLVLASAHLKLDSPAFRPGVAAVIVLAPAIVLPMVPELATMAEQGRRNQAITAVVAFSLLNICALLPLAAGLHAALDSRNLLATTSPTPMTSTPTPTLTTTPTSTPTAADAPPDSTITANLPFPILAWRLDTTLLIATGLFLASPFKSTWNFSPFEGAGLILIYTAYLFLWLLLTRT
jgi:hypothetical protein